MKLYSLSSHSHSHSVWRAEGGGGGFNGQRCRQESVSSSSFLLVTWILLIYVIQQSYSGTSGSFGTETGSSSSSATLNMNQDINDVPRPLNELSGLYPGPYFDVGRNTKSVSAIAGKNAYLHCFVKQLGNKSLSWMRTSDAHILTVDRFTFIADERFQILTSGDAWTLMIKSVTPNDTDFYECQVSTSPKLAFRTHLQVLVPTIRINSGEENMYVWEGSEVKLRCVIQYRLPGNQGFIHWLKNDKNLNLERNKSIYNDIVIKDTAEGTSQISTLTFHRVQFHNAGNYTCTLENVGASIIGLHVLSGENPAAISSTSTASSSNFLHLLKNQKTYSELNCFKPNTFLTMILNVVDALYLKQITFFTLFAHMTHTLTVVFFLDGL